MPTSRGVQERALADSLASAPIRPEDAAAVALARRLAQLIDLARGEEDEPVLVIKLAAEYRQVLVQLALTPAARGAKAKSGGGDIVEFPVNPLQAARDAARARRAPASDAPGA